MWGRLRRRRPSVTFVAILVGIVGSGFVSPSMMLTEVGVIIWLLAGAAIGAIAGGLLEGVIVLRKRRRKS
jgi:membrane associated rhomboid family serine protease